MRAFQLLLFAWGAIALAGTSLSGQIGIGASGLRTDLPPKSMKDLRDENLVKQRFDFSCGAAALATLLRYGFGDDINESQVLISLFDGLSDTDKRQTERTGFSLLDLQRVARARAYAAEGFRLEPAQLTMLGGPVIVFIEPRGYKHFAVLRAVRGDRVYLADPSRGNIRMPVHTFLDSWVQDDGKGIIFVVEPKSGLPDNKGAGALTRTLGEAGRVHPEIVAAREMLTIGGSLRPPQPPR